MKAPQLATEVSMSIYTNIIYWSIFPFLQCLNYRGISKEALFGFTALITFLGIQILFYNCHFVRMSYRNIVVVFSYHCCHCYLTFRLLGNSSSGHRLCSRGFYCPQGTGRTLQPCPAGTYSNELGLATASECLDCTGELKPT